MATAGVAWENDHYGSAFAALRKTARIWHKPEEQGTFNNAFAPNTNGFGHRIKVSLP
ncbi:hypothetical protein [Hymenobacter ruricola]|uniref:Uncharacterized protein n=1 Tax=Hymenobacter ruricola TaxID=2791023 RepID=A0ABS0HZY2_9BACT|nr:hypothetical protein [Hymenobacter ruricola]MBF9220254.1 hypothetical protein [Hymenobacter ruricola]